MRLAFTCVAFTTCVELTTTLGPNPTVVVPWTKFVNWPLITTLSVFDRGEWFGLIEVSTAGVLVTTNGAVTISLPVVIVTVRPPSGAAGSMTKLAVALTIDPTATPLMTIPCPLMFSVVTPGVKCVNSPVRLTGTAVPAFPDPGAIVSVGVFGNTEKIEVTVSPPVAIVSV